MNLWNCARHWGWKYHSRISKYAKEIDSREEAKQISRKKLYLIVDFSLGYEPEGKADSNANLYLIQLTS